MKHRDTRKLSQKEQRELRHRSDAGIWVESSKTAEMLEISRTISTNEFFITLLRVMVSTVQFYAAWPERVPTVLFLFVEPEVLA